MRIHFWNINNYLKLSKRHNLKKAKVITAIGMFYDLEDPNKFIKFTKDRLYNDKRYSVSFNKMKKLGWKPKRNLLNDLPMIVKWYKKNYRIFK